MDITKNNLDAVNARLVIKVEPSDYQEKVDSAVKNYRKGLLFQDSVKVWHPSD